MHKLCDKYLFLLTKMFCIVFFDAHLANNYQLQGQGKLYDVDWTRAWTKLLIRKILQRKLPCFLLHFLATVLNYKPLARIPLDKILRLFVKWIFSPSSVLEALTLPIIFASRNFFPWLYFIEFKSTFAKFAARYFFKQLKNDITK